MKNYSLTMRDFPKGLNGSLVLPFTEKSLIRSAIAAGQNPNKIFNAKDAKAHIDGLAALVRSSLDCSGPSLRATTHFQALGSTNKGTKSFLIGNTLCAHAAYKTLNIRWLVDIETPPPRLNFKFKKGRKRRPDFVGRDNKNQWYVFESKGRTSCPTPAELSEWKEQARMIQMINGIKPVHHIVSASHLNVNNDWEVLWLDPAFDDGFGINLPDDRFFKSYYSTLDLTLRGNENLLQESEHGLLIPLPEAGVSVGLHKDIVRALREMDYASIVNFSLQDHEQEVGPEPTGTTVFADGILIRIDRIMRMAR